MDRQRAVLEKMKSNFSSFGEIWLFIQIIFFLSLLPVRLKLLSIPRLMKGVTPHKVFDFKNIDIEKTKDKIETYTDYLLSRNLFKCKNICLKRSLVLYHFLRKLGIEVSICFGVRYEDASGDRATADNLQGHAWLVYNGSIFMERDVQLARSYKVTYCFPAESEHVERKQT